MTWSAETSRGFESDKIRYESAKYTGAGRGLDLGCGHKRIWPKCIGIDAQVSPDGAQIQGDIRDLSMFADESMPWVFSSHALEDFPAEDNVGVLSEWFRVIRVGGYLCLYCPDETLYPKMGEPGANPAHRQDLNRDVVIEAMKQVGSWDLVESELRADENEYSMWLVFQKNQ